MKKKNILILGANNRNGLATAGALFKCGYNLIGMDEFSNSRVVQTIREICKPVVFDKLIYIQKYSKKEIPEFIVKLENIIIKNMIDVVLPTGTYYTMVVSEYKNRLARLSVVPFENFGKMNYLHDKYNSMEICKTLDIPTPKTILIENRHSLEKLANEIKYPAVLKARKGAGNDGVWKVRNAEELQQIYRKNFVDYVSNNINAKDRSKPIIQEFIPGELHDVTSFSINGEPKAVLSQVRQMSSPLWGGSGIINRTTDNPDIKTIAVEIIKKFKWNGILEFDFKIDSRDGKAKLIEINPKIWGTTWLTVQAGFNMPLYLVKNALGEPYEIPSQYQIGLCARWPMLEIETWMEKPLSVKIFLKRVIRFLKMFGDKNIIYDFELLGFKATSGFILLTMLAKLKNIARVIRA